MGNNAREKLKTEELAVGYGTRVVVDDVEIGVMPGEVITLIGPNGAGKSTVLKSLIGALSPIRGTVFLDGKEMSALSGNEIAKRMAIVMTGKADAELMTCVDVVATGRYPYTGRLGILSAEDHRVVAEAMEAVHVGHLAETSFHHISDGQRQRVMLARAIAQEPEVLVLDEPTSFLDIRYKLQLLSLLRELVKTKELAVILSLHELELVEKIADRVICIRDNRVDRTGTPEEIFLGDYIKTLYGIDWDSDDAYLARTGLINRGIG